MKRFFIFAALLLTLALKADELPDKPPLILPGLEDVILRPTDMHDIDRSSARCICNYDPSSATLDFICNGTGRYTEIYLTDSYGNIMDVAAGDASQSTELSLRIPQQPGTYYIHLRSELYYGEARIIVE